MYNSSSDDGERVDLAVAFFCMNVYTTYQKPTQATDTITTSARLAFLLFFL